MADHLKLMSYVCDHCGAEPGRLCRTPKGRVAPTHSNRFYKAQADWQREHPNRLEDAARGRF